MSKNFQEWLSEGERLYEVALHEYQDLETQLDELEKRLAEKHSELNQIAHMIGKPPVENSRRVSGLVVEPERNAAPSSPAAIARALTGRGINR